MVHTPAGNDVAASSALLLVSCDGSCDASCDPSSKSAESFLHVVVLFHPRPHHLQTYSTSTSASVDTDEVAMAVLASSTVKMYNNNMAQ